MLCLIALQALIGCHKMSPLKLAVGSRRAFAQDDSETRHSYRTKLNHCFKFSITTFLALKPSYNSAPRLSCLLRAEGSLCRRLSLLRYTSTYHQAANHAH